MADNAVFQVEQEVGCMAKNATSRVVARLLSVHGHPCADLRVFVAGPDGQMVATRQGVCLAREKVGELAALVNALREAAENEEGRDE